MYLMVLPVPFRRTAAGRFATESAFAAHLRLLKELLGQDVSELVVAGPELSSDRYEALKGSWVEIDEHAEAIFFHAVHGLDDSHWQFLRQSPRMLRDLRALVRRSSVVHSGSSYLYRPFCFASLVWGARMGKVTISVTDIDNRESARMNLETGRWSRRQYLTTRLIHQTSEHLQLRLIARMCSLVLLKGRKLTADYGQNRDNVKNFLDSAYSAEHLISESELSAKLARIADPKKPLRLTYFGRLVAYKGIDHLLRALRGALDRSGFLATFDVYGDGPERVALENASRELGLEGAVTFHGAVPFGTGFFRTLHGLDVLLAAPLSQDTPRSALDAQASGQMVVAYDTYYYRDLASTDAAVSVVPWRDEAALTERLVYLDGHRAELVQAIRRARTFALENTQEQWLDKRISWTRAALSESA